MQAVQRRRPRRRIGIQKRLTQRLGVFVAGPAAKVLAVTRHVGAEIGQRVVHRRPRRPRNEQVPPPSGWRPLVRQVTRRGAPIGPHDIDVHAGLLHLIGNHLGHLPDPGDLVRRGEHQLLAVISGLGQQRLGLGKIRLEVFRSDLGAIRPAADIVSVAAPPELLIAERRRHHIGLVDDIRQRQPRLGIVERRIQRIRSQHRLVAELRQALNPHPGTFRQHRHQVQRRLLPDIHLAVLQRGGGGSGIGNDAPFHPLGLGQPPARQAVGRLAARHIIRIAIEHGQRAADPRVAIEPIRARADRSGDRLRRIALQILGAHDHRDLSDRRAKRKQQRGIRLLQLDLEALGIDRIERRKRGGQLDAHQIAAHPPFQ